MLGLFFIGPIVEQSLGPKRFLFLYLAAGVGAVILHIFLGGGSPVLGASGCLLGVVVAFAVMYPNMENDADISSDTHKSKVFGKCICIR